MLVDPLLPGQLALLIALVSLFSYDHKSVSTDPFAKYYFVKVMLVDLLLPGQRALLFALVSLLYYDHLSASTDPCANYYFVKVMLVDLLLQVSLISWLP